MFQIYFYNPEDHKAHGMEFHFDTLYGACYWARKFATHYHAVSDVQDMETGEVLVTFDKDGEYVYLAESVIKFQLIDVKILYAPID